MKLAWKVVFSVLVPLLVGVIVMVVITSVFVSEGEQFSSTSAEGAIVENQQQQIAKLAIDKANLIEVFATELVGDLDILTKNAEDIVNNKLVMSPLPNYNGNLEPGRVPVGGLSMDAFGRQSSYEAAVWYYQGLTSMTAVTDLITAELELTSKLDVHFRTVLKTKAAYLYVQLGLFDGFFRLFPYQNLQNYPSMTGVCLTNNLVYSGYDPRCRAWFIAANVPGYPVAFTAPYLSSTTTRDLVVAATQMVRNSTGEPYMALALNVQVGELESAILTTKILENGYCYVIDTLGNVIFHPKIVDRSKAVPPFVNLEFNGVDEDLENFQPIFERMKSVGNGTSTFYKQGQKWYVSYSLAPTAQYILAVVVPESDVLAPVHAFEKTISQFVGVQIGLFVAIIVVTVIVLAVVIARISRNIVQPVVELTRICLQIAKGDLDSEVLNKRGRAFEITEMYHTFGRLLTALRFGNDDYYKGSKDKAMQNYHHALEMFIQFDNKLGIGICYNNIGNVHRANGAALEAEKAYLKAVEYGNLVNEPPTVQTQRALSSRYNNLAMLYLYNMVHIKDPAEIEANNKKCEDMLHLALQFDNQTYDGKGMVMHYGNLAILFLKMGRVHEAHEVMDQITKVLSEPYADNDAKTQAEKVRKFFEEVKFNPTIFTAAGGGKPKDIIFLLDYSGSMAGAKNRASIKGMMDIYGKRVRDADRVSLILFNSSMNTTLSLTTRSGNSQRIENELQRHTKPNGGTAFFDALGEAFRVHTTPDAIANNNDKWIVALTDGEDNQSRTHAVQSLQVIAYQNPTISLVIVAVGDFTGRDSLAKLCSSTNNGKLIDVADTDGVDQSISAAFTQIGNMMDAGVETYNFKSDV